MEYGSGAIYGCPAHDQRDLDFATKYHLEVLPVILPFNEVMSKFSIKNEAYTGEGKLINSEFLNGLNIAQAQKNIIQTLKGLMENGNLPRLDNFQPEEIKFVESMNLLSTKPMVLVANLSDDESKNNIDDLNNYAKSNCIDIIPAVIKVEHELAMLEEEEQAEYLELLGMDEPVLNKIILAGYKLLGLETFFTSGPKESRAWTVYKNSLAPQAAGVIHTDFERGFIKAEVISYEDFISCNGESGAKKDGKLRLEGKDYLVKDGDVIHFKFNV